MHDDASLTRGRAPGVAADTPLITFPSAGRPKGASNKGLPAYGSRPAPVWQVMEHLQEVLLSAPQGLTDMQRESEEEAVQRHQRMLACCLVALTGLCSMLLPAPGTQAQPQQGLQQDEGEPGQAASNGTSGGKACALLRMAPRLNWGAGLWGLTMLLCCCHGRFGGPRRWQSLPTVLPVHGSRAEFCTCLLAALKQQDLET